MGLNDDKWEGHIEKPTDISINIYKYGGFNGEIIGITCDLTL
jgi:hypothetical protein